MGFDLRALSQGTWYIITHFRVYCFIVSLCDPVVIDYGVNFCSQNPKNYYFTAFLLSHNMFNYGCIDGRYMKCLCTVELLLLVTLVKTKMSGDFLVSKITESTHYLLSYSTEI